MTLGDLGLTFSRSAQNFSNRHVKLGGDTRCRLSLFTKRKRWGGGLSSAHPRQCKGLIPSMRSERHFSLTLARTRKLNAPARRYPPDDCIASYGSLRPARPQLTIGYVISTVALSSGKSGTHREGYFMCSTREKIATGQAIILGLCSSGEWNEKPFSVRNATSFSFLFIKTCAQPTLH